MEYGNCRIFPAEGGWHVGVRAGSCVRGRGGRWCFGWAGGWCRAKRGLLYSLPGTQRREMNPFPLEASCLETLKTHSGACTFGKHNGLVDLVSVNDEPFVPIRFRVVVQISLAHPPQPFIELRQDLGHR